MMSSVFRQQDQVIVVGDSWIEKVKASARAEPLRRARLNLHHHESDAVQEMIIAFCDDTLIIPHRHLGKSEAFHMVEGRLDVVLFDDNGVVIQRIRLGAAGSGLPTLYRLNYPAWHLVIPLDEMVVVHEIASGPFSKDAEPAPDWVPRDEIALAAFVQQLQQP
jgi:cupin fold WbuC family metalloprotein